MNAQSLLQRILGAVLGVALFIAAFIFTSVILAVAASVALVVWAWLWWRTRELRRAAREERSVVIEGEYRVERDPRRLDDD
jgi:protein-S-isoprenylcysteine O-methyltransferase Ste14